jgi:membrane protein DedA with SNARE-associated domain
VDWQVQSGLLAVLLICSVLFVEECGVPLPMLPGDGLLVAGGVLAASGRLSPLLFFPAATVAMCAGALIGHGWSGAYGGPLLHRVAHRVGASRHFEAARSRLVATGPWGILVCRLIPGLRVYTNLAAGAAGVNRRTFATGMVPAVLVWVVGFGALGMLLGRPIERLLAATRGGILLSALFALVAAATLVAARHLPPRRVGASGRSTALWRMLAAVAVDVALVATLASLGAELAEALLAGGELETVAGLGLFVMGGCLAYVALSRRTAGATAGEGLLRVSYRGRRGG